MFLTNQNEQLNQAVDKVSKPFINVFVDLINQYQQYIRAIIIIIIAIVLSAFLQKMVYNLVIFFATDKNKSRTNKLLRSYCNLIATVLKYFIYIFAFFAILINFGVTITTMITSAGFIGVLVTYVFQDLIKDVTNGFFIVFSSPFDVGDMVKIDNFVGKVTEIKSRYVVILDATGNRCIINNRKIDAIVILSREVKFKKR